MNLCVIPARGGSKRIPKKNIRNFCGEPIISFSIRAALAAGCFDTIVVSTDDEEISELALSYGVDVPFVRPTELSDDFTGTVPVMRHAIQQVKILYGEVDYACCVYATAPFVTAKDLNSGFDLINKSYYDYALSVTNYSFPIQRAVKISEQGQIVMFNPEHSLTRSQDLEEAWHDAGQFYWGSCEAWCEGRPILGCKTLPIKLPRYRVQDIDTEEDWNRAEWLFRALQKSGSYR